MAKEKVQKASEGIAPQTMDRVEELFIEAVAELRSILSGNITNWSRYEELRDDALQGLKWLEQIVGQRNPTGPNEGIRPEGVQPKAPAEKG